MGLWINSTDTQKIVDKLDWKFSGQRLSIIRRTPHRKDRFEIGKKRTLRRIAYKMRLWPGGSPYSDIAKKWYGFLLNLERNHSEVHEKIRRMISEALAGDFEAIKFVVVEGKIVDVVSQDMDKVRVIILTTEAYIGQLAPEPARDVPDEPVNEPDDDRREDFPGTAFFKRNPRSSNKKKLGSTKKKAKKKSKRR